MIKLINCEKANGELLFVTGFNSNSYTQMSNWLNSILIKLYWNVNETISNNNVIVKETDCNYAWIVLKNRLLKVITRYDEIKV